MKSVVLIVVFTVLGLGIGYLIFGRVMGEFIPPEALFGSRNALERVVTDAAFDLSNKKYFILAAGAIGGVLGGILGALTSRGRTEKAS